LRKTFIVALSLLLLLCLAGVAHAAPTVVLSGQTLKFDVPPTIENGRTLVPLRAIFEAMGASIAWDDATQTVTATKAGAEIKLTIGETAYKNGSSVALDVPAKVVNGRTMVPLRFVSEAMGCQVGWDEATETINITGTDQATGNLYKVTRVVDGDTIEIEMNGKAEKVRLIGVDTPETVHPTKGEEPYGKEASNFTKAQLTGQQIRLELDVQERDRYGRLLGYVCMGDTMFNEVLLREGYAQLLTIPPDVKYVERFKAVQKEAREANRGLWGLGGQVESQTTAQPEQSSDTSGNYAGSKESNKYHLPSCRYAEKITTENRIWFQTKEGAQVHGYEPCGVCKP
jgi:endonuclease YncB( thermonuclease family)